MTGSFIGDGGEFLASPESMDGSGRIEAALEVANRWGGTQEDHHRQWVVDQMVRVLTGCPLEPYDQSDPAAKVDNFGILGESEAYRAFVADHTHGEDGPDTYGWETGIAP